MPAQTHIAKKTQAIALALQGTPKGKIAEQLGVSRENIRAILEEGKVSEVSREVSVERALASAGITPEVIARKFAELMQAKDVRLAQFEGKFTDRVDVDDTAVQHRATESLAKIAGMFPKEDQSASAALFVRMPMTQLVIGHGDTCMCRECADEWERQTAIVSPVLGDSVNK